MDAHLKRATAALAVLSMFASLSSCATEEDAALPADEEPAARVAVPGTVRFFDAPATRRQFELETGLDQVRWVRQELLHTPEEWDYGNGFPAAGASGLVLRYQAVTADGHESVQSADGPIALPRVEIAFGDHDDHLRDRRDDLRRAQEAVASALANTATGERRQRSLERAIAAHVALVDEVTQGSRTPADPWSGYRDLMISDITSSTGHEPPGGRGHDRGPIDWVAQYSPLAVCGVAETARTAAHVALAATLASYAAQQNVIGTAKAAAGVTGGPAIQAAQHFANATAAASAITSLTTAEYWRHGLFVVANQVWAVIILSALGAKKAPVLVSVAHGVLFLAGLTAMLAAYITTGWAGASIGSMQVVAIDPTGTATHALIATESAAYLVAAATYDNCMRGLIVSYGVLDAVIIGVVGWDVIKKGNLREAPAHETNALWPQSAADPENVIAVDVSESGFKLEEYGGNNRSERHGIQICMRTRMDRYDDEWSFSGLNVFELFQGAGAPVAMRATEGTSAEMPAPNLSASYLNPHPWSHHGPEDVFPSTWLPATALGVFASKDQPPSAEGFYYVCEGDGDYDDNGIANADDGAQMWGHNVGCRTMYTEERLVFPLQEVGAGHQCFTLWLDLAELPRPGVVPGTPAELAARVEGVEVKKQVTVLVGKTPDGSDHTRLVFEITGRLGKPTTPGVPASCWTPGTLDLNPYDTDPGENMWSNTCMGPGGGGMPPGGGGGELPPGGGGGGGEPPPGGGGGEPPPGGGGGSLPPPGGGGGSLPPPGGGGGSLPPPGGGGGSTMP